MLKEVLVQIDDRENQEEKIERIERMGYTFLKDACVLKLLEFEIPERKTVEESIKELEELDFVVKVEPDYKINLEGGEVLQEINKDHFPKLWEKLDPNRDEITVAVIDNGIDFGHNFLTDMVDVEKSYNFVDDESEYYKPEEHGTHVAGLISSYCEDASFAGGMWSSKLVGLRALDEEGSGDLEYLIEALECAAGNHPKDKLDEPVDIINLSLGLPFNSFFLRLAIRDAIDAGCILVAASGNAGMEDIIYPAAYDNVIAVGSVDKNNNKSDFSNYGDRLDITTLGEDVFSLMPYNETGIMSGTSMATPIISGLIGLLIDKGIFKSLNKTDIMDALSELAINKENVEEYGVGVIEYDLEEVSKFIDKRKEDKPEEDSDEDKEEEKDYEKETEDKEEYIKKLESKLSEKSKEVKELKSKTEEYQVRVKELELDLKELKEEIGEKEKEYKDRERELKRILEHAHKAKEVLNEII